MNILLSRSTESFDERENVLKEQEKKNQFVDLLAPSRNRREEEGRRKQQQEEVKEKQEKKKKKEKKEKKEKKKKQIWHTVKKF